MSRAAIRAALETAIAGIAPPLPTVWENVAPDFTPSPTSPYQRVHLLAAEPENAEIGPGYTERGFVQVSLCYPIGNGPADAEARAELIRSTFRHGSTFGANGIVALISATPEIGAARIEDDGYLLPVRIRYTAHIGG